MNFAGDTNTDYNPVGHVLIVLEGNFENEKATAAQLQSLPKLVSWLEGKYKIAPAQVKGHNDYASTACPGKNMKAEIKKLQGGVDEKAASAPKSAGVAAAKSVSAPKPVASSDMAKVEAQISQIRQWYATTQANYKRYKAVNTDLSGGEGGVLTAYRKRGQIVKITANTPFMCC